MKHILFIIAIVCGIFTHEKTWAQLSESIDKSMGWGTWAMHIPLGDTIILKGSTIQIGERLRKHVVVDVMIEKLGKSKIKKLGKSQNRHLKKGLFVVKVAPKETTTYRIHYHSGVSKLKLTRKVTVYVVTSEEEKKALFEKLKARDASNPIFKMRR